MESEKSGSQSDQLPDDAQKSTNENWTHDQKLPVNRDIPVSKMISEQSDKQKSTFEESTLSSNTSKKFHDSGHVTHLRKYPEEYTTELESFLLQCKNEIDKP